MNGECKTCFVFSVDGKISSVLDLEGTGSLQLNDALSEDFVHANLSAETFDIQPLSKYISSKAQKFKAHSQLQQQQQQTINQPQYSPTSPSYSPISPSYMATNPNQHSSLASNIPKYSMQQMPIPSSNYAAISNPFGSSTNTTNTSIFSGFGALPQSQMTPSVPPPPPPPLPNALFSFGSPGSSVTNNFRKASSIFTGFGTTSQSVPPPPTSSLPGSSLFGSSSSGTSNTFGMPAMVPTYASPSIPSFGAPPPPPPSQSSFYSSSSLFGGNNNVFGTSATPAAFGTPQVYMHSTSQVHLQPHSLPGKGSFSFGTASSSYQPQLPPPPGASAFSFVTTSSSHHPQPSSSATGSANIPTSFAHTMNIGQSMFAAPPPPPTTVSQPIFTTSTTSLPLPPPPPPPLQIPLPTLSKSASSKQIETKSLLCDSSSQLKQVPTARYDECKQEESYSGDRGLEREKRSSFSGSRGRGSFLVKLRTSAGEEVHEPQMQSARYCDVC